MVLNLRLASFLSFFEDPPRAGAELSVTSAFAIGDSLAHGTYIYNGGLGHEESIARQGSGGSLLQSSGFQIFRPGGVSAGEAIARASGVLWVFQLVSLLFL
ncbi:hypothetical protein LPEKDOOE_00156 [Salmonella phage KKP 3953]|nr:hypothetical protein LPEKDOOE_00156 [Salmonella phage KKP 3953]